MLQLKTGKLHLQLPVRFQNNMNDFYEINFQVEINNITIKWPTAHLFLTNSPDCARYGKMPLIVNLAMFLSL